MSDHVPIHVGSLDQYIRSLGIEINGVYEMPTDEKRMIVIEARSTVAAITEKKIAGVIRTSVSFELGSMIGRTLGRAIIDFASRKDFDERMSLSVNGYTPLEENTDDTGSEKAAEGSQAEAAVATEDDLSR